MRILLALLIATQSFAMTRSEIRDKIRDMILDASDTTSKQHWTSGTIDEYIDLAVQDVANLIWCQRTSYTFNISTTYGSPVYTLSTNVAHIERVTIQDYYDNLSNVSLKENCIALEETTLIELDNNDSTWETKFSTYSFDKHGTPTHYYTYQTTGTKITIGFDPPTNSTRTVTIYCYEVPEDMSSDSAIPFRGLKQLYPYHDLICLWVAARMCAFDNKLPLAKYWYAQYIGRLEEATRTLDWKPNFAGGNISGSRE